MVIETYKAQFVDTPPIDRLGKYATIFVVRRCDSEAIFRTETEEISNELTKAGILRKDMEGEFSRVFMSKRKGVAPERRSGRADLRRFNLLTKQKTEKETMICEINNNMCGKCVDCRLYGSAVSKADEASLRSRVVTDEAFSIQSYKDIVTEHNFNAISEDGASIGNDGRAFNKNVVVRAGSHFLDMITLTDVTMDEFLYVYANILRTKRYGAMTTRLGKVTNIVVGIVLSNVELFSNLEWVQSVYDSLCAHEKIAADKMPNFPLDNAVVLDLATKSIPDLVKKIKGSIKILPAQEITEITKQVEQNYGEESKLKEFLIRLDNVSGKK